jgi:hypothetical protein
LFDKRQIQNQYLPILAELKDAHDTPLNTTVETIDVTSSNETIRKTVSIKGHFDSRGEKKVNFMAKIDFYTGLSYCKLEFCFHNPNAVNIRAVFGIWAMRGNLFSTNYPLNCPARI